MHFPLRVRRSAEHDVATAGNLGWCGQHEYGREEGSGASRYLESHSFDRYAALPAVYARLCFDVQLLETLCLVECFDVGLSKGDGLLQFIADQAVGLVHLLLGDSQRLQAHMVEALLIVGNSLVATCADIVEDSSHRLMQLFVVQLWAPRDSSPLLMLGIFYNVHVE